MDVRALRTARRREEAAGEPRRPGPGDRPFRAGPAGHDALRGPGAPEPLWIFGYGSLIWRPAMAHAERRPAWVEGFERRFWQGSTDHRGVPGSPGRVVTLVHRRAARCWGVAYRVADGDRDAVLEALAVRESGGYEALRVPVHFGDLGGAPEAGGSGGARFHAGAEPAASAVVWVATERNRNYLGPAPLPSIAAQVRRSRGPSGPNDEYVLRLAAALRDLGAEDPHVFALEALLRDAREGG